MENEDADMGAIQRRRSGLSGRVVRPSLGVYGPFPLDVLGERMNTGILILLHLSIEALRCATSTRQGVKQGLGGSWMGRVGHNPPEKVSGLNVRPL